ncbi:MAG: M28 family peptidase [Chloroflexota bacterium]
MDNNPEDPAELNDHVRRLSVEIGARPIGSPANQTAADYIGQAFLSANLELEEQAYPCVDWEHSGTNLEINGKPAPVSANVFSLPCDVTAQCIPLCSLAELESADIREKIVIFYGDLAKVQLSPKSWFLISPAEQRIIALLEEKRPAALLAPPAATVEYEQVSEDWELDLAAATVPRDVALALLHEPTARLHLRIDSRRVLATARNIVARRKGPGSGKIVMMAHFDTKIQTPGALDNAGGVAVLLGLASTLNKSSLACGLEFVAFNGEEYLPMGDTEYLRRGEQDFGSIIAAINMDGIGAAMGTNSITTLAANDEFENTVKSIAGGYPGVVWVDPWPESNHSTFAMRGIPSIAFGSVGVRSLAHTPEDTLDQISAAKLAEVAQLARDIVLALQVKPAGFGRLQQG